MRRPRRTTSAAATYRPIPVRPEALVVIPRLSIREIPHRQAATHSAGPTPPGRLLLLRLRHAFGMRAPHGHGVGEDGVEG